MPKRAKVVVFSPVLDLHVLDGHHFRGAGQVPSVHSVQTGIYLMSPSSEWR